MPPEETVLSVTWTTVTTTHHKASTALSIYVSKTSIPTLWYAFKTADVSVIRPLTYRRCLVECTPFGMLMDPLVGKGFRLYWVAIWIGGTGTTPAHSTTTPYCGPARGNSVTGVSDRVFKNLSRQGFRLQFQIAL